MVIKNKGKKKNESDRINMSMYKKKRRKFTRMRGKKKEGNYKKYYVYKRELNSAVHI